MEAFFFISSYLFVEIRFTNLLSLSATIVFSDKRTFNLLFQQQSVFFRAAVRIAVDFTFPVSPQLLQIKFCHINAFPTARKQDALAPVFAADDKLTVSATATTATVTAPIAHVYDSVSDDCVTAYYIVVVDEAGNIVYFKKENSWYWLGEAEPETNALPVTGLTAGTKYTAMVVAESIYGQSSAALEIEFTTPAQ
jgi:hypothetical protein